MNTFNVSGCQPNTSIIIEIDGKELAKVTLDELHPERKLIRKLQPYMQDLYDAGYEIDTVLDKADELAYHLVEEMLKAQKQPHDALVMLPLVATLLKATSEHVGIARKQQEDAQKSSSFFRPV